MEATPRSAMPRSSGSRAFEVGSTFRKLSRGADRLSEHLLVWDVELLERLLFASEQACDVG